MIYAKLSEDNKFIPRKGRSRIRYERMIICILSITATFILHSNPTDSIFHIHLRLFDT